MPDRVRGDGVSKTDGPARFSNTTGRLAILRRAMRLELLRPDDWHLHLRDGKTLHAVVADTARRFRRAIVMPNLKPPITTVAQAEAYRDRILAALAATAPGAPFEPLMTLYLTDRTSPDEIAAAAAGDCVHAVKYYPAGATTNSDSGVTDWQRARPALAAMQQHDVPLLLHGEVTDGDVDVFDRERVFLERHLQPLPAEFPRLRIVLEHVTTAEAVDTVAEKDRIPYIYSDASGSPLNQEIKAGENDLKIELQSNVNRGA